MSGLPRNPVISSPLSPEEEDAKHAELLLQAEQEAEERKQLEFLSAKYASATSGPARYSVIVSRKDAGNRTLFSSVSEKRAMKWLEDHCPRGSHFFLLTPDGEMWSYEHERKDGGPRGEDIETWQLFDRDAYQNPELSPVDAHDPWADAWEGAQ